MLAVLKRWIDRRCAACALAAAASAYSAPKTVLVLGDSLSAEYGLARGSGWVALLEQRLKAEQARRAHRQRQHQRRHHQRRPRAPAGPAARSTIRTCVVLELGANDGLRGLPVPPPKTTCAR